MPESEKTLKDIYIAGANKNMPDSANEQEGKQALLNEMNNRMRLFNQQQQLSGPQSQTPPTARNEYDYLPEGLTQEEFMKQARVSMTQQYITPEQMRQYFKPLYDSYLQEKATSTTQDKQRSVPTVSVTPYAAQEQAFARAQNNNNLTQEQLQKANEQVVQESNLKNFLGIKPQSTPVQTQAVQQSAVTPKPIQTPIAAPGLMNQPEEPKSSGIQPSQYRGINTNVRGLMR